MYAQTVKQNNDADLPDYDTMRKQGIRKKQHDRPYVELEDFRKIELPTHYRHHRAKLKSTLSS